MITTNLIEMIPRISQTRNKNPVINGFEEGCYMKDERKCMDLYIFIFSTIECFSYIFVSKNVHFKCSKRKSVGGL